MNIQQAINKVIEGNNLSREEMQTAFTSIFSNEATDAQKAGLLVALRMKGETVDEITAAAEVMREFSEKVKVNKSPLVDIVGTGGDGLKTLNVSTAATMVVAAAGGFVAKHGNRAASSQSGSADLLEASGAEISLNAAAVASCIENVGLGFMFAPVHHSAMKHAIGPRKELATRTIFNILGPLTNPANAERMVIGVFDKNLCRPIAEVLKALNCEHALVVHGDDGMDEISICTNSYAVELKNGVISELTINPKDYGFSLGKIEDLTVKDAAESLAKIKDAFAGNPSAAKDIICINAAAAIYVAGLANNLEAAIEKSRALIDNGEAAKKFEQYINYTQQFAK